MILGHYTFQPDYFKDFKSTINCEGFFRSSIKLRERKLSTVLNGWIRRGIILQSHKFSALTHSVIRKSGISFLLAVMPFIPLTTSAKKYHLALFFYIKLIYLHYISPLSTKKSIYESLYTAILVGSEIQKIFGLIY